MYDKLEIEIRCRQKAAELLEKHFPNFIQDAAITRPETLDNQYNDSLPGKVAEEFRDWLASLWEEIRAKDQGSFDQVMNLKRSLEMTGESYAPYLSSAREEAQTRTLWEKLTKTNHEDVTYYKGLLKQYTEELLEVMVKDFVGDVNE